MTSADRASIQRRLGPPTEQLGSVNDPRSSREADLEWNEKWIYLDGQGVPERVVLWHRYDLVGVFRVGVDGELEPEPLTDPADGP